MAWESSSRPSVRAASLSDALEGSSVVVSRGSVAGADACHGSSTHRGSMGARASSEAPGGTSLVSRRARQRAPTSRGRSPTVRRYSTMVDVMDSLRGDETRHERSSGEWLERGKQATEYGLWSTCSIAAILQHLVSDTDTDVRRDDFRHRTFDVSRVCNRHVVRHAACRLSLTFDVEPWPVPMRCCRALCSVVCGTAGSCSWHMRDSVSVHVTQMSR